MKDIMKMLSDIDNMKSTKADEALINFNNHDGLTAHNTLAAEALDIERVQAEYRETAARLVNYLLGKALYIARTYML